MRRCCPGVRTWARPFLTPWRQSGDSGLWCTRRKKFLRLRPSCGNSRLAFTNRASEIVTLSACKLLGFGSTAGSSLPTCYTDPLDPAVRNFLDD
mmetsp:Transcript_40653/g.92765  ORF Transcript_40653/g.92765 Transcript_40653/m.92765 type:complete len:94 (-) Transcript_40653:182-463(-)